MDPPWQLTKLDLIALEPDEDDERHIGNAQGVLVKPDELLHVHGDISSAAQGFEPVRFVWR